MMLSIAPGLAAGVIAVAGEGSDSALVAWCTQWWWTTLGVGFVAYVVLSLASSLLLKCPACGYRLARAGLGVTQLAFPAVGVLHCPHCGVAWQSVRSRGFL